MGHQAVSGPSHCNLRNCAAPGCSPPPRGRTARPSCAASAPMPPSTAGATISRRLRATLHPMVSMRFWHSPAATRSNAASTRCAAAAGPPIPMGAAQSRKKRQGIVIIAYDSITGVAEFEPLNGAVEEAKLQVPIAAEYALKESEMADPHLNMIRDVVPSADGCEDCLLVGAFAPVSDLRSRRLL